MYDITTIAYTSFNFSLIELIQITPPTAFYTHEKPPLVLLYHNTHYWCELSQPDQTQNCLMKSVDTIEQLLNIFITYHHLDTAHPVIQALFITRSPAFLSQTPHTTALIPFLSIPSSRLEKQYRDISALPNALLKVMIDKQYALKQCHYFCRFDTDFLIAICHWFLPFHPTASQLKHGCQLLFDITRRNRTSIKTVISSLPDTSLSDIMTALRQRHQPTLSQQHQELELIKSGYSLPVSWDPTLEKREVKLTATIRSDADFTHLINTLTHPRSQEGIHKLLAHL